MSITLHVPTEADFSEIFTLDERAFGFRWSEEDAALRRPVLELPRFRVARDGRELVGMAGTLTFEVTLPGGASVPAGGLTWVGVQATHRRRGILRQLIEACHDDMRARGEVVAMLHASEAGIYGRFGYGASAFEHDMVIDLQRTALRPELAQPDGSVRYADDDAGFAHHDRLWDAWRHLRPGELSRSGELHSLIRSIRSREADGATPVFHLVHPRGYAAYRIKDRWEQGHSQSRLEVIALLAMTPAAHLALWQVLLSVDLVTSVRVRDMPADDPLPSLLTNRRAARTESVHDGLWLKPLDLAAAFGARTYGTTDRVVLEVAGERIAIDGSPEGAEVRRVRSKPDLVVDVDAAGPLLLGGVRAGALAAAGSVRARSAEVLRRADRFFLADVAPCSTTMF